MAAKFVLNRQIDDILNRSTEMRTALQRRADRVAVNTRRYAADDRYRDSVRTKPLGAGRVRVGTDYWFAHLDEWGSINNPPSGAMRRGVQAAGLRLGRATR